MKVLPCKPIVARSQSYVKHTIVRSKPTDKENPEEGAKLRNNWDATDRAANRKLTEEICRDAIRVARNHPNYPGNKKRS